MEIKNVKKLIITGFIIFVIVIFIFVWNFFFVKEKKEGGIPTPTPIEPTTFQKPYQQSEKITIANVVMDNFYKEGRVINKNNDVMIEETSNYRILYLPLFQQFIINILNPTFTKVRNEAETAFIKKVAISEKEACRLKVIVVTTYSVNPEFAKKSYPLSFCE